MLSHELETMETAEDLFVAYGVPFDARVLTIHRLAILRRFGLRLARIGTSLEDADQRRRVVVEALAEAHAFFANGGRQERPAPRENLVTLRVR
jgi:hypothetical protein